MDMDWEVEGALKIESVRWRYFKADDETYAIWTTTPMYQGGDFMAALWKPGTLYGESDVLEKSFFPRRKDAKQQAKWWFMARSAYVEYVIQEEP